MARNDNDLVKAHRAGQQDAAARAAVRNALVSRRAQASVDAQEGSGKPIVADHNYGMARLLALMASTRPATRHPGSKRGAVHVAAGRGNTWRAVTSQRRRGAGKFLTPTRFRRVQ